MGRKRFAQKTAKTFSDKSYVTEVRSSIGSLGSFVKISPEACAAIYSTRKADSNLLSAANQVRRLSTVTLT
jgi:hypothetical protein